MNATKTQLLNYGIVLYDMDQHAWDHISSDDVEINQASSMVDVLNPAPFFGMNNQTEFQHNQPYGNATSCQEITQSQGIAMTHSQYEFYDAAWYNAAQYRVFEESFQSSSENQIENRSYQGSSQLYRETIEPVIDSTITSTAQIDSGSSYEGQSPSDPLVHETSSSENQIKNRSDQGSSQLYRETIESVIDSTITSTAQIDSGSSHEGQSPSDLLVHETAQNTLAPIDPLQMDICTKGKEGCDITKMFVKPSDGTIKKLCCPFCLKLFAKLPRHIESVHVMEADVQKLLSYPKGSKGRRELQDDLRKSGTFKWNMNSDLNKGALITSRRPNPKLQKKPYDYKTCPFCRGIYANLRYHVAKKCIRKPPIFNDERVKGERALTLLSSTLEARYSAEANEGLRDLFNSMRDDKILRLIKFDWTLIEVGNRLCTKYTNHFDQNMLSTKLRVAGRILSTMREIDAEVQDFASIYKRKLFDSFISAIKVLGKFNTLTKEFDTYGTAQTCVAVIKQFGRILKTLYSRKDDTTKELELDKFLNLAETDLPYLVSKAIANTKSRVRRETKPNLPTSADIKQFADYLAAERLAAYDDLKTGFVHKKWLKLSEVTMASMIVFNRRRVGETQNILLKYYTEKDSINEATNGALYSSLSAESKKVAGKYSRMTVRGKLDRTVPVLLSKDVVKCIDLLIKYRKNAGVNKNNLLLFGLPSLKKKLNHIKGCIAMNKYARMCGVVNISSLTGTNIRKHLATFCISLELNDGLVAEVADHMGHHTDVHRNYYRKNPIDRQVVQMAQLLEAAQGIRKEKRSEDHEDDSKVVGTVRKRRGDVAKIGVVAPKRRREVNNKGSKTQPAATVLKRCNVIQKGTGKQVGRIMSHGTVRKRRGDVAEIGVVAPKRRREVNNKGSKTQPAATVLKRCNVIQKGTGKQDGRIMSDGTDLKNNKTQARKKHQN